eukprot:s3627_g3.t1
MVLQPLNPAGWAFASCLVFQNWLFSDRRFCPLPISIAIVPASAPLINPIAFGLFCGFWPGFLLDWGYTMAACLDHTVLPAFAVDKKFVLILYPGERKWHERLVVLRSVPSSDQRTLGWCIAATPDGIGTPIGLRMAPLAMPLVPLRLPISEVLRRPSSMPTSARSIRPMPAAFWLKSANSGVLEHESICKALELAIECDQLNIGELATVWLLCRSLQMIQYRWKDRILGSTSNGTVDDESHFFLGVDPTRGNLCICTAFNIWPGEELHKEAQANKEQRKAWEERAFPPGQQGKEEDPVTKLLSLLSDLPRHIPVPAIAIEDLAKEPPSKRARPMPESGECFRGAISLQAFDSTEHKEEALWRRALEKWLVILTECPGSSHIGETAAVQNTEVAIETFRELFGRKSGNTGMKRGSALVEFLAWGQKKFRSEDATVLLVTYVEILEWLLEAVTMHAFDRYACGAILFGVFSRSRVSDMKKSFGGFLDFGQLENGGEGYIECRTRDHKTANAVAQTGLSMPLLAPALGVTKTAWAVTWAKVSEEVGLAFSPTKTGPVLPAPNQKGGWTKRCVDSGEVTRWMRALLVKGGCEVPEGSGQRRTASPKESCLQPGQPRGVDRSRSTG